MPLAFPGKTCHQFAAAETPLLPLQADEDRLQAELDAQIERAQAYAGGCPALSLIHWPDWGSGTGCTVHESCNV